MEIGPPDPPEHTPTRTQAHKIKQTTLNFSPKEKSPNTKEEDHTSAKTNSAVQKEQDAVVLAAAEFSSELSPDEDTVPYVERQQEQPKEAAGEQVAAAGKGNSTTDGNGSAVTAGGTQSESEGSAADGKQQQGPGLFGAVLKGIQADLLAQKHNTKSAHNQGKLGEHEQKNNPTKNTTALNGNQVQTTDPTEPNKQPKNINSQLHNATLHRALKANKTQKSMTEEQHTNTQNNKPRQTNCSLNKTSTLHTNKQTKNSKQVSKHQHPKNKQPECSTNSITHTQIQRTTTLITPAQLSTPSQQAKKQQKHKQNG